MKIKVKVNDAWRIGTLLDAKTNLVGVGEPHYFNYTEKIFPRHEFKEYIEISQEDADKIHKEQLPKAFQLVENALQNLLPTEKAEIKDQCIQWNNVTLDPVLHTRETIGKFIDVPAWQVSVWHHIPQTRYEPENIDQAEIQSPTNYQQAVKIFLETVFKEKLNQYFQKDEEIY